MPRLRSPPRNFGVTGRPGRRDRNSRPAHSFHRRCTQSCGSSGSKRPSIDLGACLRTTDSVAEEASASRKTLQRLLGRSPSTLTIRVLGLSFVLSRPSATPSTASESIGTTASPTDLSTRLPSAGTQWRVCKRRSARRVWAGGTTGEPPLASRSSVAARSLANRLAPPPAFGPPTNRHVVGILLGRGRQRIEAPRPLHVPRRTSPRASPRNRTGCHACPAPDAP